MAKEFLGGMTDYSHQSFQDILDDIKEEKKQTNLFRNAIQNNIDVLTSNSYWQNNVPFDFRDIVAYSLRHYNTAIVEFDEIYKEMNIEVKQHHINRLKNIATVAQEINVDIGRIWHQRYYNKDYGNENFRIVENIYGDTRDMAVRLLDISNIAHRLNDFLGKININNMKKNNPYLSGSFYLISVIVILAGLAVLSKIVHWTLFPVVIVGVILIIGLVGILQLRNDDRITDKSFTHLIKETYKRLPLVRNKQNKDNE